MTNSEARESHRRDVLKAFGASSQTTRVLLRYNAVRFDVDPDADLPLPDEPCVADWQRYAQAARQAPLVDVLRGVLVQLRFSVASGISCTSEYRRATRGLDATNPLRHGAGTPAEGALAFDAPDALSLDILSTSAGHVPVLTAGTRADFERLVQALAHCNEPADVPASMGALTLSGLANWERLHRLRTSWQGTGAISASRDVWKSYVRTLDASQYTDRLILVSPGPYSNTSARAMGMAPSRWETVSRHIRREHEATHYVTRRLFGSMRNAMHDELLADAVGMIAATGAVRPDWFLQWMGLDATGRPAVEKGTSRLDTYRGDPPLSDEALQVLGRMTKAAIEHVAQVHAHLSGREDTSGSGEEPTVVLLMTLASHSLEEIAASDAPTRLPQFAQSLASRRQDKS